LTQIHVRDMPRKMGRKKLWAENVNLTLPEGAKARMDAALEEGEDRLDLIRDAIEKELKRREKAKKT
jgi:metal-responsive CopG/Arc/MetJ family transcriptional regulator